MMDPIRDAWTDRLSEYVDGELDAAERGALEVHLQLCERCSGTVEELRAVLERARALEARAPETDLWPAIEARLAARAEGARARPGWLGRAAGRPRGGVRRGARRAAGASRFRSWPRRPRCSSCSRA